MAPGQQNEPVPGKDKYTADTHTPAEINSGARQQNQLDELNDSAAENPREGEQIGASPGTAQKP